MSSGSITTQLSRATQPNIAQLEQIRPDLRRWVEYGKESTRTRRKHSENTQDELQFYFEALLLNRISSIVTGSACCKYWAKLLISVKSTDRAKHGTVGALMTPCEYRYCAKSYIRQYSLYTQWFWS
jgi:hypothetical protein